MKAASPAAVIGNAGSAAGTRPRLGISACLLGREVRYDGGHKHDSFLTEVLGPFVEWVPVCPEVEIGLGTPRPPIRLEGAGEGPDVRLVMPSTGEDLTARMRGWARERVAGLAKLGLSGYVLKKDSPTCGVEGVEVHGGSGPPARRGRGIFAAALLESLPWLPVEEEGRLGDPRLRENFVSRVFAVWRWRRMEEGGLSRAALHAFHQRYEMHLMARDPAGARRLGRMLGESDPGEDVGRRAARYLEEFTQALSRPPTRGGHASVLRHLAGHVSERLDRAARAELAQAIERYRRGLTPLSVPVALLRRHAQRLDVARVRDQGYLDPHPSELRLLNHV